MHKYQTYSLYSREIGTFGLLKLGSLRLQSSDLGFVAHTQSVEIEEY